MKKQTLTLFNLIAQTIFDKKGSNILVLDVREITALTDYVIIAEGNVDRHVKSIAQAVIEQMKDVQIRPLHVEGKENGDWIVIDFVDIVVHLFMPQIRQKYQLEKLWQKAKIVDVDINIESDLL